VDGAPGNFARYRTRPDPRPLFRVPPRPLRSLLHLQQQQKTTTAMRARALGNCLNFIQHQTRPHRVTLRH
jgi:hypothetical protein